MEAEDTIWRGRAGGMARSSCSSPSSREGQPHLEGPRLLSVTREGQTHLEGPRLLSVTREEQPHLESTSLGVWGSAVEM